LESEATSPTVEIDRDSHSRSQLILFIFSHWVIQAGEEASTTSVPTECAAAIGWRQHTESSMDEARHIPVMLREAVESIAPRPGQVLVDGTLGGGGHTRALAERLQDRGFVLALDRDPQAIERAAQRLAGLPVKIAQANFCDVGEVLAEIGVTEVDAILLDLGLSSEQLSDASRGFSFDAEGLLDLRFDPTTGEPASRLVNRLSEQQLADLIYKYGEERFSRRIARAIVVRRNERSIQHARELAHLIRGAIPRTKHKARIDPATRTFQALRIAVNDELKSLELALARLPNLLKKGGRLAIISFHSLEDRMVKDAFRNDPQLTPLVKKPLRPTEEEVTQNPRSRSAKLRIAQRN
jgi:16S rRNA (cytosine1402-N4)-methyltransferase